MSKYKVSPLTHTKAQMNHHANQLNPNNPAYKGSRKKQQPVHAKVRKHRTPYRQKTIIIYPAPAPAETSWGDILTGVAVGVVGSAVAAITGAAMFFGGGDA